MLRIRSAKTFLGLLALLVSGATHAMPGPLPSLRFGAGPGVEGARRVAKQMSQLKVSYQSFDGHRWQAYKQRDLDSYLIDEYRSTPTEAHRRGASFRRRSWMIGADGEVMSVTVTTARGDRKYEGADLAAYLANPRMGRRPALKPPVQPIQTKD